MAINSTQNAAKKAISVVHRAVFFRCNMFRCRNRVFLTDLSLAKGLALS
jgi:hypothetical protein